MKVNLKLDDREFQKAMRKYADMRGMDLPAVLNRRARSLVYHLGAVYKQVAPTKEHIQQKMQSLGMGVKVREPIKKSKGTWKQKIKREQKARIRAINWTTAGWAKAGVKMGIRGDLARMSRKFKNQPRGKIVNKKGWVHSSITIINSQVAAGFIDEKHNVVQKALDKDTKDMYDWMYQALEKQRRRANL